MRRLWTGLCFVAALIVALGAYAGLVTVLYGIDALRWLGGRREQAAPEDESAASDAAGETPG